MHEKTHQLQYRIITHQLLIHNEFSNSQNMCNSLNKIAKATFPIRTHLKQKSLSSHPDLKELSNNQKLIWLKMRSQLKNNS